MSDRTFDGWSETVLMSTGGKGSLADPHHIAGLTLARVERDVRLHIVCDCDWTDHVQRPKEATAFDVVAQLRALHAEHAAEHEHTWTIVYNNGAGHCSCGFVAIGPIARDEHNRAPELMRSWPPEDDKPTEPVDLLELLDLMEADA